MKKTIALIIRIGIVIATTIGLFLQLYPNQWHQLTYYTLLSNIVVWAFFLYLLGVMRTDFDKTTSSTALLRTKGGVTIAIMLTFLVYHFMLAPIAKNVDFYNWKNYLLHYTSPILVILDWVLFDKRHVYKWLDPIRWTALPLLYTVFALIKGYVFQIPIPDQSHSPYPYFFVDINQIGWNGFAMYFVAILVGYMLLGYIMLLVKGVQKKKAK